MWWLQTRAYYFDLDAERAALTVVPRGAEAARPVPVTDFEGIDSESSPIRFRACFRLDPVVVNDAEPIADPTPLTAPGWFDCYDAEAIGAALEAGEATAILSRRNDPYGIDRVIAVLPDGRAFAWRQINECGDAVFDGQPAPEGCPPAPEDQ
ncbi:histidine kinase [Rhodobacteraceae bacterium MCCB 386]|nr:histidine kinase [Roseitranquillus sediminis]